MTPRRAARGALLADAARGVPEFHVLSLDGKAWELDQGFLAGQLVTVAHCFAAAEAAPWVEHEGKRLTLRPSIPSRMRDASGPHAPAVLPQSRAGRRHAPPPAAPASPAPASASPAPASPAPGPASSCAPPALSAKSPAHAEPTVRVEPTLISVLHWGRLLDGELFATSRYVEWAVLMKRTFGFDALRCPRCERKKRALSVAGSTWRMPTVRIHAPNS